MRGPLGTVKPVLLSAISEALVAKSCCWSLAHDTYLYRYVGIDLKVFFWELYLRFT